MEKQKNTQLLVIAILSIALLTMSVGFAAYSTSLNITGNVTVQGAVWNVQFDTNSYQEGTGSVNVSDGNRTIGTTAMTFNVTLEKPGDFYEYTIDVKNTGTFDAQLISATIPAIESPKSNYLRYTVSYQAVKGTGSYEALTNGTLGTPIDLVKTNGVASVKVRVEYFAPEDSNLLPASNTNATFTIALNYKQKEA